LAAGIVQISIRCAWNRRLCISIDASYWEREHKANCIAIREFRTAMFY